MTKRKVEKNFPKKTALYRKHWSTHSWIVCCATSMKTEAFNRKKISRSVTQPLQYGSLAIYLWIYEFPSSYWFGSHIRYINIQATRGNMYEYVNENNYFQRPPFILSRSFVLSLSLSLSYDIEFAIFIAIIIIFFFLLISNKFSRPFKRL